MFLKKINVLLFLVLNFSVTMGLRFFHSRKKKRKCIVREQWNFHYVTCATKHQICCETGCCDSANHNAATTYIKMAIVCSVIVFCFMLVYIEMWCKKRCNKIFKNNLRPESRSDEERSPDRDRNGNCEEMRTLNVTADRTSRSDEEEESDDDTVSGINATESNREEDEEEEGENVFSSALCRNDIPTVTS